MLYGIEIAQLSCFDLNAITLGALSFGVTYKLLQIIYVAAEVEDIDAINLHQIKTVYSSTCART